MKLLYCKSCHDIFNLTGNKKTCSCQKSAGYYINDLDAIYSGDAIPLGFSNSSFTDALKKQPEVGPGKHFVAFIIEKNCKTFKKL
jgi:hypothetical protein